MKNFYLHSAFICLLFVSACQTPVSTIQNSNIRTENNTAPKPKDKQWTIDFATSPSEVKKGEPAELLFTIKNPDGETVKNLQIVHEKLIHLLIVSEDLSEFYHEHPEMQSDGTFKASFTFPNGGIYKLYTDFTPENSAQVIRDVTVDVAGEKRAANDLKVDDKYEKTVDGLRVTMKPDGDLIAGQESTLGFEVRDANTNQPAADLENYLGAKAHFVIISRDLEKFVHAHPSEMSGMKTGEDSHGSGEHSHGANAGKAVNPATVSAHVLFPKASVYRLWAQFQRGGKVITVPFTFEVKAGTGAKIPDAANVAVPNGYIKIVASKDGFTPSRLTVKSGEPVKLAFYRADAENCANEVVFKDANITKKLPVGEVVTIDLPAAQTGEISFACGMNMYQGKIIVQ